MAAKKDVVKAGPVEEATELFPYKTQDVPYTDLKVGDDFLVYGTIIGTVHSIDPEKGPAGVHYMMNDRLYPGLLPSKGTLVTKVFTSPKKSKAA